MFLFKEKVIGVDVSDHTIEAVELFGQTGQVNVASLSRVQLEPGIVENGRIKNEEKLSQSFKALFSQAKPHPFSTNNINFSLPDNQLFSHVFYLKNNLDDVSFSETEVREAVLEEVRTNIPIKEDDLVFSFKILSQKNNELEILVIASSKQVVTEWKKFFTKQKLNVDYFDSESLATFRGIFNNIPSKPVCVVDIGETTSSILIFNGRGLRYSRLTNVAGDLFSSKIAEKLKVDFGQAENIKINNGLDGTNVGILSEYLETMTNDIKEAFDYFQNKTGQTVEKVVLIGGSSRLKGLVDYLQSKIGLTVQIGDSEIFKNKVPLLYVEAVGVAIRSFDKKWQERDPVIDIKNIEASSNKKKERVEFSFLRQEEVSNFSAGEAKNSLNKQKKILIITVISCLIVVFSVVWYKNIQSKNKNEEISSKLNQLTQSQSFVLKIPVAVDESEYTGDRVRGRLILSPFNSVGNYDQELIISKEEARKNLKSGEVLWDEPLASASDPGQSVSWLAYLEKDANSLFLSQLKDANKENVVYELSGEIKKAKVESTDNQNIFYLYGELTILTQKLIDLPSLQTEESVDSVVEQDQVLSLEITPTSTPESPSLLSTENQVKKVVITNTPTGWLNVRQGPGTNYGIVFRAYPGESYEALEVSGEWQKIKKSGGEEGWVSIKYIKTE